MNKMIIDSSEIINQYFVILKLIDSNCTLHIKKNDSTIYDGWDYTSPTCYSIILTFNALSLKVSINERDNEYVLRILDHYKDKEILDYLDKFEKKHLDKNREIVDFTYYQSMKQYIEFEGFFGDEDLFINTLKDYLEIFLKNYK